MEKHFAYEALSEEHAKDLIPIWSDEDVIRYTNIKKPCTMEEIADRIKVLKPFDVFAVRDRGEVIGIIGCPCIDRENALFGVFYQFRKSAWGQGCATCAAGWLINRVKNKYPGAAFCADVVTDNIASEKILLRLGFVPISEEPLERDGVTLKVRNYSGIT